MALLRISGPVSLETDFLVFQGGTTQDFNAKFIENLIYFHVPQSESKEGKPGNPANKLICRIPFQGQHSTCRVMPAGSRQHALRAYRRAVTPFIRNLYNTTGPNQTFSHSSGTRLGIPTPTSLTKWPHQSAQSHCHAHRVLSSMLFPRQQVQT